MEKTERAGSLVLAAVFLTWGWSLPGTAYMVVALVGLLPAWQELFLQ